ncbi:RE1-silencing transcription factor isoform X1 [Gadus morhua]|uniref:RE1-silencing transcription factor n=1 Tax=Gadus morhua TaxID=8049 RepID=A0A8C5C675_GADMO|nr:RE1-silencing transcription factor isoform X1 [Gadus morhua]
MATRAMFPAGVFSVGGEMVEDEGPSLSDLPGNNLPVPQLVMLANAATAVGGMESAAEDGASCDGLTEEKDMVELKTVGCTYSDSEGESVRYSYDQQNRVEFCIVEYVDSPGPRVWTPAPRNKVQDDHEAAEEEEEEGEEEEEKKKEETKDSEEDGNAVKDLSKPQEAGVPDTAEASAAAAAAKRRSSHAAAVESAKKKKPFHCKPCNYQAENEEEFVEHLGTHAVSKRMVLNRVEGRSKAKGPGAGGPVPLAEAGGGDEADSKGVIRCERCGYNTNRLDHYVAHLKHHSKEGEDQRVFKCTLCPYTTVSQYHWRKHLRNHFPSKLHTCDQCSYFSDRKSNYIQHIRKHTGMRPFRCPYCDYSSSQKTHLTRHMRTHSGERPFKCDTCNYLAANQHEVTRHARQVHNGPKPLACPYCLYKTADRSNFKKHVELHLNPRQFHCPLCKYAASKKCNLQYHIKSRHVGCDIPIDVSKVKLRVKKGGEDSADPSGRSKADKVRGGEDDEDDDDDDGSGSGGDFESDEEYGSKLAAAPIAPSAKKGGGHTQAVGTDGETDRGQRKAKTAAAVKHKGALEGKEKAVRKVTTRQRKVARAGENTKEKCTAADGGPADGGPAKSRDPKAKRSARKKQQLPKETPCVQEAAQPDNPNEGQVVLQRSIEEMKKLQKERRIEKVRKAKQEDDKPKADVKTNKRLQSRRTGAKKPDKGSGKPVEDVSVGNGPEESPEVEQPARKVKVGKRRAIEALDLSTKHSAATPTSGLPSPKRSKTSAANKPATKPSLSKTAPETPEPGQAPQKEEAKQKKTRKTTKRTPVLQEAPASIGDTMDSVTGDTSTAPTDVQRSPPETQSEATHPQSDSSDVQKLTKPRPAQPKDKPAAQETAPQETAAQEVAPQEAAPPAPEKDLPAAAEVPSRGSGPGEEEEETPCAVADRPPAPTFRRPGAKAPRPSLELPRPAEEDEGIHSSHEGASDASDCASEGGSEDSGLNSAGAGSGKMANDPETPTDEIPTPTELKCHLCVFCDRTFPLEVEYRRHLNRHLVNVYYPAEAGK